MIRKLGLLASAIAMSCGGNTTSGGTSPDGGQQPVSQPLTVSLSGSGSVSSTPAGIDCGATCSASFASGAQVTLHATPAVGNVFSGWSGGCSGSGDCSVTMSAAVSVAAAFVKAQVRLTVSKQDGGDVTLNPAGTSCGTGCSTYDYGTSVTVTVSALTGHSASLSGGGCASTPCTIALTSDTSVSASFPLVKVKLNEIVQGTGSGHFVIDPIGASCGNGCLEYDYGTQVSINAVADTGSDQTGLTIPGCHTTSCQLTGDITVVAVFTLQELNYTAALSGTGTGSFTVTPDSLTTCSGCFAWNYGTTVTITGIPSATSDFDAVSFCNGSSCSSCDTQPCSFVATESGTFTAAFKLKTVHLSITTAGRGQGSVKSADGKLNCGACTADYTYGDQVKLSTTTITGFQGWGGACSGQGLQCTLTMAGDQSVEGDFNNRGIFLLSGAPSLLFRFDPAFDSTLLGGINPQVPGGLAWLPTTGTLYGGDGSSTIFSFDPFSGSAIGRGSDGGFNIEGFTWSPTSSSFYGVSVGSPDKLFKLSLDSGDPVLIGTNNVGVPLGMTWDYKRGRLVVRKGGDFYSINTATGASTLLFNTGETEDGQYLGVAYDPFDDTYWSFGVSGTFEINPDTGASVASGRPAQQAWAATYVAPRGGYYAIDESGNLTRIDPNTHAVTSIGNIGVPFRHGDCSWNPAIGKLTVVDGEANDSGGGPSQLWSVDLGTAAATQFGPTGAFDVDAIAWVNGTLYGIGGGKLYQLSPFTGGPGLATAGNVTGLTWDSVRQIAIGITNIPGNTQASLVNVNLQTGAFTQIRLTEAVGPSGFTYDYLSDQYVLADDAGDLIVYDPQHTNDATTVATGLGANSCLAFVPYE